MASRNITLMVRVLNAGRASRDLMRTTAALHQLGIQSRRTSDLVRQMGHAFHGISNVAQSAAQSITYSFGAMSAAAVKTGLNFNATIESQKVAFANILGSKKAADDYVDSLVKIASETPFRLTDIVQGSRSLLAFGMRAKEARTTMTLLGNAIATGAGGADEIAHASRALGQIQAAGVLHAQDLMQLIQANVLSLPLLTKRMGTTTKKFRKDMELGKISAEEFFTALRTSWEKDPMYKGAAAKAAKTYQGQLERLKDYSERAFGAMTFSLFNALRKRVFPAVSNLMADMEAIWKDFKTGPRWDLATKIELTKATLQARFAPIKAEFMAWWNKEGRAMVLEAYDKALQWLLPKLDEAVKVIGKALWKAFKDMGTTSQVVTGVALATMLGITQATLAGLVAWMFAGIGLAMGRFKGKTKPGKTDKDGVGVMTVYAKIVNVYGPGGGSKRKRRTPPPAPVPPPSRWSRIKGAVSGAIRRAGPKVARGAGLATIAAMGADQIAKIPGIREWYESHGDEKSLFELLDTHQKRTGLPGPGATNFRTRGKGDAAKGITFTDIGNAITRFENKNLRPSARPVKPRSPAQELGFPLVPFGWGEEGPGRPGGPQYGNDYFQQLRAQPVLGLTGNYVAPDREGRAPIVINLQVDGKTIGTATHRASTKKKSTR